MTIWEDMTMGLRAVAGAVLVTLVAPNIASAQTIGTFRWQLQPYCNVITVTVTQVAGRYTVDGIDDQCGAPEQASVSGLAFVNPSGSVGFGLTIVSPGATVGHVSAAINLGTLSGSWNDNLGHGGAFHFNPAAPVGSARPLTSTIRIAVGHQNWVPFNSTDNLTFTYFSNRLLITKATAASQILSISPSLPVVLDGRRLRLLGMELCYQANANAVLSSIALNTNSHVTNIGDVTQRGVDNTNRTDEACRFVPVTSPYVLEATDAVSVVLSVAYQAGGGFRIGRTSLVVEPTTTAAPLLDPTAADVTLLPTGASALGKEPPK